MAATTLDFLSTNSKTVHVRASTTAHPAAILAASAHNTGRSPLATTPPTLREWNEPESSRLPRGTHGDTF
ncbi:hypothetical protein ACFY3J_16015 [Streptomyces sp. NPDC001231]|uniref:hypothetical protein n=1 Tax=Streptomyces sp. NPDC001231 TaxID=3364549 RepID=UPI0036748EDB